MSAPVLFLLACCLAVFSYVVGISMVKDGEDGSVGIPALIMVVVLLLVFGIRGAV